ncbi:MAG: PAS domain S-box protein, partial [Candidatus Aminicenantes bacterium]|nr:PAS domain S-box protein [Candidatus Aminicenantes bacterium]
MIDRERRSLIDEPSRASEIRRPSRGLQARVAIHGLIATSPDVRSLLAGAARILKSEIGLGAVRFFQYDAKDRPQFLSGKSRRGDLDFSFCRPWMCASSVRTDCPLAVTRRGRTWSRCVLLRHGRTTFGFVCVTGRSGSAAPAASELKLLRDVGRDLGHALRIQRREDHHRRLEAELTALKDFHQNIVASLAEGILIEDAQGIITFVNPSLERLLDYKADELIGLPWTKIVPPREIHSIGKKVRARRTRTLEAYPASLLARDGREIPVLIGAQSLFDGDRLRGVLSAFTDI